MWLYRAQLSSSWKCACSARISLCSSTSTATSGVLSLLNVCHVVFRLFCLLNTNGYIHTKLSLLCCSQKRLKLLPLQTHNYPTVLDLCSASDSLLLGSTHQQRLCRRKFEQDLEFKQEHSLLVWNCIKKIRCTTLPLSSQSFLRMITMLFAHGFVRAKQEVIWNSKKNTHLQRGLFQRQLPNIVPLTQVTASFLLFLLFLVVSFKINCCL